MDRPYFQTFLPSWWAISCRGSSLQGGGKWGFGLCASRSWRVVRVVSVLWAVGWVGGIGAGVAQGADLAAPAMRILKANCVSCHDAEKRKGGLDLGTREAMMVGGDGGAVVSEGMPDQSVLLTCLAAEADPHMPPKKQLSVEQVGVLAEWLRGGAPWDAEALAGDAASTSDPVIRQVALAPLPDGYRPVMAMALSPDGRRLAAGSGSEVMMFDVTPEALVLRSKARGHLDAVQSMAWMPDGRSLVTGAFRRLMIWQADGLVARREVISGLTDRITAVQGLPDGRHVLLADGLAAQQGVVRMLDTTAGEVVRSWAAHDDTIFAMALTTDGASLATAGGDQLVRLWDVATGKETAQLEAHSTQVLCLAFNADHSQLVTGGADRELKVWDVGTRENTTALAHKLAGINAAVWSPGGAVYAVTEDGALLRYTDMKAHTGAQSSDTGSERQLARVETALYSLAVAVDGERIFAGTSDGKVLVWNKDGVLLHTVDTAAAPLVAATSTPAAAPAAPEAAPMPPTP